MFCTKCGSEMPDGTVFLHELWGAHGRCLSGGRARRARVDAGGRDASRAEEVT